MAGEVEAFREKLDALHKAEAELHREADPARRRVLAERVAKCRAEVKEATREVGAAAKRGDRVAVAFIDALETDRARRDEGEE